MATFGAANNDSKNLFSFNNVTARPTAPLGTQLPAQTATGVPSLFNNIGGANLPGDPDATATTNAPKPTITSTLYANASAAGLGDEFLRAIGQTVPGQPLIPGATVDLTNIRPTTRFSDLNPGIQKSILEIHDFISSQIEMAAACSAVVQKSDTGNETSRLPIDIEVMPRDVEMVKAKLETVQNTLRRDTLAMLSLKNLVSSAEKDMLSIKHAIESVKLPSVMKMSGLWNQYFGISQSRSGFGSEPKVGDKSVNQPLQSRRDMSTTSRMSAPVAQALEERNTGSSQDIIAMFKKRADVIEGEIESLKRVFGEIETHIILVESRAAIEVERLARGQHGAFNAPSRSSITGVTGEVESKVAPEAQEIIDTMKLFETAILRVAGRISELREKVVRLSAGL